MKRLSYISYHELLILIIFLKFYHQNFVGNSGYQ